MTNEENLAEMDRFARAYGFEIGRGQKISEVVKASDDNPFLDRNWREVNGLPQEVFPSPMTNKNITEKDEEELPARAGRTAD